jgi:hypothetical protein
LVFCKTKELTSKTTKGFRQIFATRQNKVAVFGACAAQERSTAADARTWLKDLINTNP